MHCCAFFWAKRPHRMDFASRLCRARTRRKPSRFARPHPLHRAGIAPRRYLAAPPNHRGGRNQRYAPRTCPLEQISEPFGILPAPKGKIFRLDNDTAISTGSLSAAHFAAGSAVQAVDMVMNRKAWHAFCAARPPGHHAGSGKAGGFCLLNNVAAGVMHAIAEYRLKRIAVIDFDVHYGDGTAEIFKDDPRILFSTCLKPTFPLPRKQRYARRRQYGAPALAAGNGQPHIPRSRPQAVAAPTCRIQTRTGAAVGRIRRTPSRRIGQAQPARGGFCLADTKIIQTASGCPGKIVSVLEGGYTLEPRHNLLPSISECWQGWANPMPQPPIRKHWTQQKTVCQTENRTGAPTYPIRPLRHIVD